MIERISEIKTNLENLFSLIEGEVLEQRKEIQALTQRIKQLEDGGQREQVTIFHKEPQTEFKVVPEIVPMVEPIVEPEIEPEAEPEAKPTVVPEIVPEWQPEPTLESKDDLDLFLIEPDEEILFEIIDVKKDDSRKSIIGDLFSLSSTIGGTVRRENPAWMDDLPGDRVDNVADAVSLNDRIIFVRELFDFDNEQFALTLERLNEMIVLAECVNYLRAAFPDWDESSDIVYRFYMIIRRKFRS